MSRSHIDDLMNELTEIHEEILDSPKPHQADEMTVAEYRAMRDGKPVNKYGNQRCEHDGLTFDSILEKDVYLALCEKYGKSNVHRQPSFLLGPGVRFRPDFMLTEENLGSIPGHQPKFLDAKGRMTEAWRAKAEWFRQVYPWSVECVTRDDLKRGNF